MNASYATSDQMVINVYFHLYHLRGNLSIKYSELLYTHFFWAESPFFVISNNQLQNSAPAPHFAFFPHSFLCVPSIQGTAAAKLKFLYIQLMITHDIRLISWN